MNRKEIVVPRASWSDVFSDDAKKAVIPGAWRLMWSQMGPAEMHLTGSSLLSKEWGEVQPTRKLSENDFKLLTRQIKKD